jgi:hypothetical protein
MSKSILLCCIFLLVGLVILSIELTQLTTQAKSSAEDKADSQANKGHIRQADRTCEKAGYNGYIGDSCGYLN